MTSSPALPNDFLRKVSQSLEEEEVDIYTMMLYCMNSDDMNYFDEKDRKAVKKIFKVLMNDTRRHADLLKLILDLGGG
jgi:rubrerythrin